MTKPTRRSTALLDKLTDKIVAGDGIRESVAADAAKPVKFDKDDGVHFNPLWQDDVISTPNKTSPTDKQSEVSR